VEKFSKRVSFTLKAEIYDAPARADVKKTIGQNSEAAYDRCPVMGIRVYNRMDFRRRTCTPRDSKSFKERLQDMHHCSTYSCECLPLDMAKDFPLYLMHTVYLGVVKKLITLWKKSGVNSPSPHSHKLINERLLVCQSRTPIGFQGKCCNLQKFMSGAMIDLKNFVREFEKCYGSEHLIYNIHSVQLIADDVEHYGRIRRSVHSGFAARKQVTKIYRRNLPWKKLQLSMKPK
ncbi:calcium-transporting atpase sarcoplasmic endoplasmic reticulum type (calcium pump), partial [Schistosoma japonicum]